MKFDYIELQTFNQWWVRALLIALSIIPFLFFADTLGNGKSIDFEVIGFAVFIWLLVAIIASIRLITKVNSNGIAVNFWPFVSEFHSWKNIKSAVIAEHKTLSKGIIYSVKYGLVYNVKGSKGLVITYHTGDVFFIGTQNPEKLISVVQSKILK